MVHVKGEKRGVILAWHVTTDTLEADAGLRVVYDVLPHSPGSRLVDSSYLFEYELVDGSVS